MRHPWALVGLGWIIALMRNAHHFLHETECGCDLRGGGHKRDNAARFHLQV